MVVWTGGRQNLAGGALPALIAAIAFVAVMLVLSRGLIRAYNLDPWLFSTIQMGVGGGVMIAMGVGTNPRSADPTNGSEQSPLARAEDEPAGGMSAATWLLRLVKRLEG